MPNTLSSQSKLPSEDFSRAAAHYIQTDGGTTLSPPPHTHTHTHTHAHLYNPGVVEERVGEGFKG